MVKLTTVSQEPLMNHGDFKMKTRCRRSMASSMSHELLAINSLPGPGGQPCSRELRRSQAASPSLVDGDQLRVNQKERAVTYATATDPFNWPRRDANRYQRGSDPLTIREAATRQSTLPARALTHEVTASQEPQTALFIPSPSA